MGKLDIGPTEKLDNHLKTYVETSVYEAIKRYQVRYGIDSVSRTVRDLIIRSLEDEHPQI